MLCLANLLLSHFGSGHEAHADLGAKLLRPSLHPPHGTPQSTASLSITPHHDACQVQCSKRRTTTTRSSSRVNLPSRPRRARPTLASRRTTWATRRSRSQARPRRQPRWVARSEPPQQVTPPPCFDRLAGPRAHAARSLPRSTPVRDDGTHACIHQVEELVKANGFIPEGLVKVSGESLDPRLVAQELTFVHWARRARSTG